MKQNILILETYIIKLYRFLMLSNCDSLISKELFLITEQLKENLSNAETSFNEINQNEVFLLKATLQAMKLRELISIIVITTPLPKKLEHQLYKQLNALIETLQVKVGI